MKDLLLLLIPIIIMYLGIGIYSIIKHRYELTGFKQRLTSYPIRTIIFVIVVIIIWPKFFKIEV